MSSDFKNYYKILGVEPGASDEEIADGFKKLQREFHPDVPRREGESEEEYQKRPEKSKDLGEAYYALGSGGRHPEKRREYDKHYVEQNRARGSQESLGTKPGGRPKDVSDFLREVLRESARDIFRGYGQGMPGMSWERRTSQRKAEFIIPENDLGLLAALREAYRSKEAGTWDIKKSEGDKREWMPELVYQVQRDSEGRVSIFRTIKDWREKSDREKEIKIRKEGGSIWKKEYDKVWKPDVRLSEYYLLKGSLSSIEGWFGSRALFPEYLEALKNLAKKLAAGAGKEGSYKVSDEAAVINQYTKAYPSMYRIEGDKSSFPGYDLGNDPEVGRVIPYGSFLEEIRNAEKRVTKIHVQGKEGQTKAPQPEGKNNSGENKE